MSSTARKLPRVFLGTYTESEGSQSEGIYVHRMDPASGQLAYESVVKGVSNPSFLEIHPQQGFLYSVNEVGNFAGRPGGGVSSVSISSSDDLKVLNTQPSQGDDPCYISIEQTGRFALVANYTSGSVAMLPIQTNGELGPATDVIQHSGMSIHPERQTGPHAHCIVPDPTNRFAIATDLGLDKLLVYRMDLENGRLNHHAEVHIPPGAGPRHLTFHPSGRYAYLINELNSTVIAYGYHLDSGSFEELQTVPTLPSSFRDENLCADIHVSPNGKFLYASNRGHDSIVLFLIDDNNGQLTYESHTSTGGREPRNFAIDPGGKFLLAANQKSNTVITFKIDPGTGTLTTTGHVLHVPTPVCIKFA